MPPDARQPSSETTPAAAASTAPSIPWQPLTPRGVAAFATARWGWLLAWQLVVAGATAGAVLWFFQTNWFPAIRDAIAGLPDQGVIQNRQLSIPIDAAKPLAENRFLAILADPDDVGTPSLAADVRIEFHRRSAAVCSLFGCIPYEYPEGFVIQANRPEVQSHWGAWKPTVCWIIVAGTMLWLLVNWFLLATIYCPFVRLYSYFKDREITLASSWKLCAAALLPAAVFATTCIVLYGLGLLPLLQFLILWSLHIVTGWCYLILAPLHLPRFADAPPKTRNPFDDPEHVPAPPQKPSNPFTGTDGNPS